MADKAPEDTTEVPTDVEAGFRRADTDVDDYPAWDFELRGPLRGRIVKVKTITLIRRGDEAEVRMAVVDDENGGHWALWESANLKSFFDCINPNNEIYVQPAGNKPLSGGRTMKVYRAYYR